MKIRTATLFGALMMMLVLFGVSYAMWDKTLWIYGTVNTGEVDVEFTDVGCFIDQTKPVATCTCLIISPDTLTVTIENGYPCCTVYIDYWIENTGTIPVVVESFTVSPVAHIDVTVTGIVVGTQIDPGQESFGDLEIHVLQSAAQLSTYTFTVTIHFVQWNEYP